MPPNRAVLLMAYGSPAGLDEVEAYYTDIRRGRRPPPDLLSELVERYRLVGGKTPLLEISRAQATALQNELGDTARVFLGMKHWHPYIRRAMADMQTAGIDQAVGVVLAPHFSRASIGEYAQLVEQARHDLAYDLRFTMVESWHLNQHYLKAVERHVREKLKGFDHAPILVFTAHSLPVRAIAPDDPYREQLLETSAVLASRLGFAPDDWRFSFQSAGRTPEPWLRPDVLDTVHELAAEGVSGILVVPIGFVSDHLEILYDLDREAKQAADADGVRLERVDSLNVDPELIGALAEVVRRESGTLTGAKVIAPS